MDLGKGPASVLSSGNGNIGMGRKSPGLGRRWIIYQLLP